MNCEIALIDAQKAVVFSPHQDDAELACGGLIRKRLVSGHETYIVYLTDGRNSHLVKYGIREGPTPSQLKELRKLEAIEAQQVLGNHPDALRFFDFDDGMLFLSKEAAIRKTADFLSSVRPSLVIVPYRKDRHPDHVAAYDIVTTAVKIIALDIPIYQYFVRSLRDVLQTNATILLSIDIKNEVEAKKSAILKFKTQITCFSEKQSKPLLDVDFLKDFYSDKEFFLPYNSARETLFPAAIRTAKMMLGSYKNLCLQFWKLGYR